MAIDPKTLEVTKYLMDLSHQLDSLIPFFRAKLLQPNLYDFKQICDALFIQETQQVALKSATRLLYYLHKNNSNDFGLLCELLQQILDLHRKRAEKNLVYRQTHCMVELNIGELDKVTSEITDRLTSYLNYYKNR